MTPSISELAFIILNYLRGDRLAGHHTPEHGVKAQTLVIMCKTAYQWDVTDRMIRLAVNMLRKQDKPIGSSGEGYYYVLKSSEWNYTRQRLLPTWLDLKEVMEKIEGMAKKMEARERGIVHVDIEQLRLDIFPEKDKNEYSNIS